MLTIYEAKLVSVDLTGNEERIHVTNEIGANLCRQPRRNAKFAFRGKTNNLYVMAASARASESQCRPRASKALPCDES